MPSFRSLTAGLFIGMLAMLTFGIGGPTMARTVQSLPPQPVEYVKRPTGDWLINPGPFKAGVYRGEHASEIVLSNGLIRRVFRIAPNAATVALDNLATGEALLRGVKPEAIVEINGRRIEVGGLKGQPNYAYLLPQWVDELTADAASMKFVGFEVGNPTQRLEWKRVRHHAPDANWPPRGVYLRMDFEAGESSEGQSLEGVRVSVHYELYDGLPAYSKWITVHNGGGSTITVDRFTSELLAAVEYESHVETREGIELAPPNIHVETDYAFGGFHYSQAMRFSVHWVPDPDYETQVSYLRLSPCLLEVRPTVGPDQDIAPEETFESFRAFVMPFDGTERTRNGLAVRRLYRTIAPWVTENPLMHHMLQSDPAEVRRAIDEAAEVGFEMIILSFGSGFNIESEDPAYIHQWKEIAAHAHAKGIEIGGYSLLSSRRISPDLDNAINPETGTIFGQTFGTGPALASRWGQEYFRKLYSFFETTGFDVLEHDGPYPGDFDAAARPPLQKGVKDSQWVQWRISTDFYKWCRARGVYLNTPDYYYLAGSNKCGMGYRETNWSLPRAQQVIHTRQNIYDGTWEKTPSMGWMFVPLAQYHGGGAAATIEPLHEHLDHYERMLTSNLGLGVQACYRGPRLYDTEQTKALVKHWVSWFKEYRDILESDLVHGRRADGRDIDWMLHVNPALERKGMLLVYNPLPRRVEKTLRVNLYYTGLTDTAKVRNEGADAVELALDRDYTIELPVSVPAEGMTWYVVE